MKWRRRGGWICSALPCLDLGLGRGLASALALALALAPDPVLLYVQTPWIDESFFAASNVLCQNFS